ncbi:MAG: metal ABC transporter permease [Acidimicrobiales bacterium]
MTASSIIASLLLPGLLHNQPVRIAALAGGIVAIVLGVVGTFTVIRGQSFAGHALADVGAAGGSAAVYFSLSALTGFVAFNVIAAGILELIGVRRAKGRDLATGIVLGAALGVAALFLYLDSIFSNTTGVAASVLFGSILTLPTSQILPLFLLGIVAVGIIAVTHRPLLLASLEPTLASARGLPVRTIGALFLLSLAIAVSLSAIAIGAILSTALLIGPAAAALRIARRPSHAMLLAGGIAFIAVLAGLVLSYESYGWPPLHHGWPVSFFVVAIIYLTYFVIDVIARRRSTRTHILVRTEEAS